MRATVGKIISPVWMGHAYVQKLGSLLKFTFVLSLPSKIKRHSKPEHKRWHNIKIVSEMKERLRLFLICEFPIKAFFHSQLEELTLTTLKVSGSSLSLATSTGDLKEQIELLNPA